MDGPNASTATARRLLGFRRADRGALRTVERTCGAAFVIASAIAVATSESGGGSGGSGQQPQLGPSDPDGDEVWAALLKKSLSDEQQDTLEEAAEGAGNKLVQAAQSASLHTQQG